jgi:hypothetical protein
MFTIRYLINFNLKDNAISVIFVVNQPQIINFFNFIKFFDQCVPPEVWPRCTGVRTSEGFGFGRLRGNL